MPVMDERHDFAHPVEGDEAWSESYYFNGYDPETDCGLYTRIGVRPNEGTMDIGLSVWLPDMEIADVRAVKPQTVMTDDDLEVGGVRYERVEPLKTWRLTASCETALIRDITGKRPHRTSPLAMDLTFKALTPAMGGDGQGKTGSGASAQTGQMVGKGHLEQAGRWSGWIEVDGQRRVLGSEARGNRDKSWGPRKWGGPKMWRWFSINLGDDVHFGGIRIGTEAGDLHRGWVWRDGKHSSIRDWDVRSELADDGVTHTVTLVKATDADGRVHQLRADLLRVWPGTLGVRPNTTIVNEGLARWSTPDGLEGYGISEYLHQLDDDARPVVTIE